jgi:hypothetical protein
MIVVEEIARADAAAAWNLMLATYGPWGGILARGSRARSTAPPTPSLPAPCSRVAAPARSTAVFVVDGRWSFASGIRHSAWWNAGCLIARGYAHQDGGRDLVQQGRAFEPTAAARSSLCRFSERYRLSSRASSSGLTPS